METGEMPLAHTSSLKRGRKEGEEERKKNWLYEAGGRAKWSELNRRASSLPLPGDHFPLLSPLLISASTPPPRPLPPASSDQGEEKEKYFLGSEEICKVDREELDDLSVH